MFFSKFAWVVPLKNKQGLSLKRAMATIFRTSRRLTKLKSEKGPEIYNRHVKDLLIDEKVHVLSTQQNKSEHHRKVQPHLKKSHVEVFHC